MCQSGVKLEIISACEQKLAQTPLVEWINFIEVNKSKFNGIGAKLIWVFIN